MARFLCLTAALLFAASIIVPVSAQVTSGSSGGDAGGSVASTKLRKRSGCPYIAAYTSPVEPAAVQIPPAITVSSTEGRFYLRLYAKGTQNYRCNAGSGWTFVEPKASLYNIGQPVTIGKHYFLATPDAGGGRAVWEGKGLEGCGRVVTKKIAEAPSPNGPANIPWLKTAATSTGGSANSIISKAKFVLRVRTKGGQPPDSAMCGGTYKDGTVFQSPYTTEYWFYGPPQ